jgi:hypothetical protein
MPPPSSLERSITDENAAHYVSETLSSGEIAYPDGLTVGPVEVPNADEMRAERDRR